MTFDLGPALLFCPADRPDRFRGALEKADAVILDLEDAVLPEAKAGARQNLIDADLDRDRVIVRVNAPGSDAFAADLATLAQTDFRTIMVAKTESAESLAAFDERFSLIALCETARGVHAADRIAAHPQVVAMMWGAEDLVASSAAHRVARRRAAIATSPATHARGCSWRREPRARAPSTRCTSTSRMSPVSSLKRSMRPHRGSLRQRASTRVRCR